MLLKQGVPLIIKETLLKQGVPNQRDVVKTGCSSDNPRDSPHHLEFWDNDFLNVPVANHSSFCAPVTQGMPYIPNSWEIYHRVALTVSCRVVEGVAAYQLN